jgi:uncharacterized protein (TIGR02145 family)
LKNYFIFLFGLLFIFSCKKEDEPNIASVQTTETELLFGNTIKCSGTILNPGTKPILAKGFCWSTDSVPNIKNSESKLSEDITDTFQVELSSLLPLTKYYITAFGTNELGTFYGNVLSLKTDSNNTSILKDNRDNRVYKTVFINDIEWMAENLAFNSENSSFYNNDSAKYSKYGRLYNWDAAANSCPTGWVLPEDDDWMKLEAALGMTTEEITNSRIRGWEAHQVLDGGIQSLNINLTGYKWGENWTMHSDVGRYWTSSKQNNGAYYRGFQHGMEGILRSIDDTEMQYSVRCIRK